MAGFDGHLKAAVVVGILFTAYTLTKLIANGVLQTLEQRLTYFILAFAVVVIFGILLDIDVWSSIPRRLFGKVLIAAAAVVPLYLLVSDPSRLYGVGALTAALLGLESAPIEVVGAGVVLVSGIAVAKTIGLGLDEFISHRGIIHSKEFVLGCGAIAFVGLWYWGMLPTLAAGLLAVGVVLGGFVHLSVDAFS